MLHYPKMPDSRRASGGRCTAFEKYDGTKLHWEWDRDFGWHSFGARRAAFNLTESGIAQFALAHAHLRECADVFRATLADALEKVFRDNPNYARFDSTKVFTEFFVTNSFVGLHKSDDPKRLVLFDVWAEPFGMVGPEPFVADFGPLGSGVARVVYRGKLTGAFVENARTGKYDVAEGVVCKGGAGGPDL